MGLQIKIEVNAQKYISIAINRLFDFADIRKNIAIWNKFYKDKKYEFLSREDIYDKIIKIIDGQTGGNLYYYKYIKYKNKYTDLKFKK